jgi:hypothetical protein
MNVIEYVGKDLKAESHEFPLKSSVRLSLFPLEKRLTFPPYRVVTVASLEWEGGNSSP